MAITVDFEEVVKHDSAYCDIMSESELCLL